MATLQEIASQANVQQKNQGSRSLLELAKQAGVKPKVKPEGFLKRAAKAIARPFVTTGVSAVQAGRGVVGLGRAGAQALTGDRAAAARTLRETEAKVTAPVQVPGFGGITAPTTPREVAGTALQVGGTIFGGGIAGGALKGGIRGLGRVAATEATAGGLIETGAQLEEGQFRPGRLAAGVGLGALGGGAAVGANRLFGKAFRTPRTAKEIIDVADEFLPPTERILGRARAEAPRVSIRERFAGLTPDVKKRIQGKPRLVQDYFNVAHARNLDDTLPTPLEFASQRVGTAEQNLQRQLSDTGSDIGKFRSKIETVRVPVGKTKEIAEAFDNEISKLNLSTNAQGDIIQNVAKATKVSQSEINLLKTLRENLRRLKANPTAANLIENRIIFDQRINFAKRAGEVSNVVDPVSRRIRSIIAKINRDLIGKEQAALLREFELIIQALEELQSFTGRNAGAEFLLKRVLSERGARAREIIATVKKHTGIDLLDDATMARVSTDLIGNEASKGLFRQEITKAGLDASKLLKGDVKGAAQALGAKGVEFVLQPEKTFLKAARKGIGRP